VAGTTPAARGRQAGLAVGTVLAIAASIYFFAHNGRQTSAMPKSDGQFYEAVGAVVAEETIRLLGNQGRVVVLTPRTGPQPSPVHASFLRGFESELAAKRGVKIAGTERIAPTEAGCPATAFLDVLKQHPTADAVVSFIGPPVFQRDDLKRLPARRPKLLALGGDRETTRTLMGQQVLDVCLAPRRATRASVGGAAKTRREEVERLYEIVTPATVAAWVAATQP